MFPEFPLQNTLTDGQYVGHTRSSCVISGAVIYSLHNEYGRHLGLYRVHNSGKIEYCDLWDADGHFNTVHTRQDLFS